MRTLEPVKATRFPIVLVMTTSILLRVSHSVKVFNCGRPCGNIDYYTSFFSFVKPFLKKTKIIFCRRKIGQKMAGLP